MTSSGQVTIPEAMPAEAPHNGVIIEFGTVVVYIKKREYMEDGGDGGDGGADVSG